jgi:hypothetical protein
MPKSPSGASRAHRSPAKSKRKSPPTLAKADDCDHVQRLVESLLAELSRGVSEPALRETDEWKTLFGTRQTVVVNLQKLVQVMVSLLDYKRSGEGGNAADAVVPPITAEELGMLKAWLRSDQ